MTRKREELTQAELKEHLHYDPDTGIFTRIKSNTNSVKVGDEAGSLDKHGYVIIYVNKLAYKAHRLAWLYINEKFPLNFIDHIDGIKDNNKFINLRDVTTMENSHNQIIPMSTNKCGFLGVSATRHGNFTAQIMVNGVKHCLGNYPTPEEAHQAYLEAKRRLHPTCTI